MNSKYKLLAQIPKYKSFRTFRYPKILPINFTVSITYHCNSRCKTCNVWKKKVDELSFEEFDKIFKKIGEQPYWFTISGGEPFLRNDIVEICNSIYDNCKPGIINIPTNGILYQKIPKVVEEIVKNCPDTQIIINISLDDIRERHDEIRCIKDNYEKTINTYNALRQLDYPNFELGIHTVISKFNAMRIPEIYKYFQAFKPDSYITEIAEERVELGTIGAGIAPEIEDYLKAINFLSEEMNKWNSSGVSKMTKYFRLQYYDLVKKILKEKRQIIPCYAGFASAHIAPNGDVWMCCVKAESIGNLRDVDYNFDKVWFGEKANVIRCNIESSTCFCPLANASYTNMIHNFNTLLKIGLSSIR